MLQPPGADKPGVMQFPVSSTLWRRLGVVTALAAVVLSLPVVASAQSRQGTTPAIGEQYHVEIGGTFWNPDPFGVISSGDLTLIGNGVDLVGDLGYQKKRFREFKMVVRPGLRHRVRFNYTPIEYTAQATLVRDISFAGRDFTIALPIQSSFSWKVWRFGYEWDFLYKSRGFMGVMVEGQWTEAKAKLTSLVASGEVSGRAVLPAVWFVARAYPLPDLALNLEVGGMKIPKLQQRYEGHYVDWDLSATVNITNNLGAQFGWRRMTNYVAIDNYAGDLKFQGIWWGIATRF